MERVLFIRLSALGDLIVTLPALAALRRSRPDVVVDWVVEDRFAELLHLCEGIDRVIVFPRKMLRHPSPAGAREFLSHVRSLRQDRYSVAVDFQGNLKGAMHLFMSRTSRRIGLDRGSSREGAHLFTSEALRLPDPCHRVERALTLIKPLGIDVGALYRGGVLHESLRPRLRDDPEAAADAESRLAKLCPEAPRVLLHPGTSAFGRFKRWSPERFGELARELSEINGAHVIVSHGPGEADLAERVREIASGAAVVWTPAHGLAGLVAILRRVDLMVAADSGPLLLASALGTRTVALFGPKDPRVYSPPFGGCRVVNHPVPCSPCSLRSCDNPICMSRLPVSDVQATVTKMLS